MKRERHVNSLDKPEFGDKIGLTIRLGAQAATMGVGAGPQPMQPGHPMELKVVCNCGQKFKFDVEPVNGRMPFTVNCPTCGLDGTATANTLLAQNGSVPPSSSISLPPPLPAAAPPVSRPAPASTRRPRSPPYTVTAARHRRAGGESGRAPGQFNLGLGIVGALLGAGLGAAVIVAIAIFAHIRIPLLGVGTGYLTSLGARILGKGGDSTLGILSAILAVGGVVGSLFFIYGVDFLSGEVMAMNLVSILVSAYVAYRVASR